LWSGAAVAAVPGAGSGRTAYMFSLVDDIALRCPRRVRRRNSFACQCRSDVRSARYYAGGDGAARHPCHPAKHIPDRLLASDTPEPRSALEGLTEGPWGEMQKAE
jgi:hypothetical protein